MVTNLACCLLLLPLSTSGEVLKLKDGTIIEGRIVNENVSLVIIETGEGRKAVPRHSIDRIEKQREIKKERAKSVPRPAWKVPSRFIKAGKLEYLPDKSYVGAAREAMDSAKKSIDLIMYYLKPGSMETDELIDSLIIAGQRDVDVKVLLGSSRNEDISHFHEEVYHLLKDNGVDVKFSGERDVTRARLLVIDDDVTLIGSHNWTESGLSYNSESSILVKSGEFGMLCGEYARGLFKSGRPID